MSRPFKGSSKEKIINLHLQGATNKQICKLLKCHPITCRVVLWQHRNPENYKQSQRKYYQNNKKKVNKDHYAWAKRNRDLCAEYRWRHKCNKAGVDWRMAG